MGRGGGTHFFSDFLPDQLSLLALHGLPRDIFRLKSCRHNARATSVLQLLLGDAGHVTRLDDDGAGEETLSEELEHSLGGQVDDGHLGGLGVLGGDHGSDLGHVARGLVCNVLLEVVVTHTNLTEVTRVVLVKPDPVVVLSSGVSAS